MAGRYDDQFDENGHEMGNNQRVTQSLYNPMKRYNMGPGDAGLLDSQIFHAPFRDETKKLLKKPGKRGRAAAVKKDLPEEQDHTDPNAKWNKEQEQDPIDFTQLNTANGETKQRMDGGLRWTDGLVRHSSKVCEIEHPGSHKAMMAAAERVANIITRFGDMKDQSQFLTMVFETLIKKPMQITNASFVSPMQFMMIPMIAMTIQYAGHVAVAGKAAGGEGNLTNDDGEGPEEKPTAEDDAFIDNDPTIDGGGGIINFTIGGDDNNNNIGNANASEKEEEEEEEAASGSDTQSEEDKANTDMNGSDKKQRKAARAKKRFLKAANKKRRADRQTKAIAASVNDTATATDGGGAAAADKTDDVKSESKAPETPPKRIRRLKKVIATTPSPVKSSSKPASKKVTNAKKAVTEFFKETSGDDDDDNNHPAVVSNNTSTSKPVASAAKESDDEEAVAAATTTEACAPTQEASADDIFG